MASLPLDIQLFVDGAWTTYPAYAEPGWTVQIGPDDQSGIRANNFGVTLQNDDLSMDPSNVSSPLYGKIGRNTPARLRISSALIVAGEASQWTPSRTVEHVPGTNRGRSDMGFMAEGLIRRLGRWEDELESPITRQIGSYASLLGFFPMEDPAGAQTLQNKVAGGQPGNFAGTVTLSGDDGAGGAAAALELGVDGAIGGAFLANNSSGWQISFQMKLAAMPSSSTLIAAFQWADTAGRMWYWRVSNGGYEVAAYSAAGTLLGSTVVGFGAGVDPTKWTRYRMRCTVSGGTLTYEPAWYPQDALVIYGTTGTFAATSTGQPYGWQAVANAWTNGAAFGMVFAVADPALNLISAGDAVASFNGYLKETTRNRFLRLLGENGFPGVVLGNVALAARMGRQKPGKLLDLLTEIQVTEAGLIFDDQTQVRLVLRLANNMINPTVNLALTKTSHVKSLIKKIDDVQVANDITATNWDGTKYRGTIDTGGLSTLVPPAGVGRYKGSLDVSFALATDMPDRVNWELRNQTIDRPRYEQITIDLLANPGLRATINTMLPGDVITLAGEEPDPVPLRVLTIARAGGAVEETATLTVRPADLWTTGAYGSATTRYNSSTTTLQSGVTSTATTLVFTFLVSTGLWSRTSAYDVLIDGERIGIPAGGMSAVSGTGPFVQTATGVTRSKNGVVKALAAGRPISVALKGAYRP